MSIPGGAWIVRLHRAAPGAAGDADWARSQGAEVTWCGKDCPWCANSGEEEHDSERV